MDLPTVWFLLIAALFVGYFVLEGFDFGVGILLPVLGRDDTERRVIINTIGPVWDGNEVWVLVAGGATFAAFPHWYATVFSALYLPLLAILVALTVRGVAFEYRGKRPEASWKARWDTAIVAGSLLPAVLWGVALATIVRGLPLHPDGTYSGDLRTLLHPYGLLGGATTGALFVTHGAVFLSLKTAGELRRRAGRLATRAGVGTVAVLTVFLGWTVAGHGTRPGNGAAALAVAGLAALLGGLAATRAHREGWAFAGTAGAIALSVATMFATLHPNLLPSRPDPAHTLTIAGTAASDYTLHLMTWVALLFAPLILLYQGWTYWVFRRRIGVQHLPEH